MYLAGCIWMGLHSRLLYILRLAIMAKLGHFFVFVFLAICCVHGSNDTENQDTEAGAYLFIQFREPRACSLWKTEMLAQGSLDTQGGRFVGITRKNWDMKSTKWPEAMLVFWFKSTDDARTFFESAPNTTQPDSLALARHKAWAVNRSYTPGNEPAYYTFMISEIIPKVTTQYGNYTELYTELLEAHDAQPFVVQSMGAESLRRHYVLDDTQVIVHLVENLAHLDEIKEDSRWDELLELQAQAVTVIRNSVFTIDPSACP